MTLSEQTKQLQSFMQSHPHVTTISDSDELHSIYTQLIDCLVDHNHLYYVENAPIISDKEYDDLFAYLKKIEELHPELISSNSPTQGLIGQVSEGFLQAEHKYPLLSLENTYDSEDLKNREARTSRILEKERDGISLPEKKYIIEPKYDGLSVELIYKNGTLVSAITRGDGKVGEEIILNALTIKGLKDLKIKDNSTLHVRGEIIMPKSVWKDLNKEREEEGEIPFANTRNAASGSIKLLDSNEVKKRKLICFVYDVLYYDNPNIYNENGITVTEMNSRINSYPFVHYSGDETYEILGKYGLPIFPRRKECDDINEVINICNDPETKEFFDNSDYDFDGLVIKINEDKFRDQLKETDHHPRRAVAYKFPAQLASTQIVSVDFQVGRTGIITPVANLQPIELSGVTIKRVSLHNFDFIQSKDLHIGDYVWIQRSGEVIPYIVSVITERRENVQEIAMPKSCPSCGGKVRNEDIHHYCTNPTCTAKLKEQILHFVSKNCMDIQGIGESIVEILVDQKIVQNIADIYRLPDHTTQVLLRKFPGIGDKKIAEIVEEIEKSKQQPLRRLLNGLGIAHVGKKMAQDIVQAMVSQQPVCLEDIMYILSDREFLITIYGIGEKTVETVADYFSNKDNQEMLIHLRDIGMKFTVDAGGFDLFKDKKETFSITGTFPVSREQIVSALEKEGYIFHDTPNKSTQLMLIGEKAGSKKEKAQELGLTIYEGWDILCAQFPFLQSLSIQAPKNTQNKPSQVSLF